MTLAHFSRTSYRKASPPAISTSARIPSHRHIAARSSRECSGGSGPAGAGAAARGVVAGGGAEKASTIRILFAATSQRHLCSSSSTAGCSSADSGASMDAVR